MIFQIKYLVTFVSYQRDYFRSYSHKTKLNEFLKKYLQCKFQSNLNLNPAS